MAMYLYSVSLSSLCCEQHVDIEDASEGVSIVWVDGGDLGAGFEVEASGHGGGIVCVG